MMKKMIFLMAATVILMTVPQAVFSDSDDIAQIANCPICGMSRQQFAHARVLLQYEDGSRFGACSLHCASLELAYRPDRVPMKIQVGDYGTKELIDAEQAVWVIGGSKMGVMTANAKWAFADARHADQFISAHGGRKADLETALSESFADMYRDTKMIREKRKKMQHMQKQLMHGDGKKHE